MTKLTHQRRERFLAALRSGDSIAGAARSIAGSRQGLYGVRERDPVFAAAWDDAVEEGTDRLEDVAVKRAKDKSDILLMFLLNGRRPDKFRPTVRVNVEHSVVGRLGAALDRLRLIENTAIDVTPVGGSVVGSSNAAQPSPNDISDLSADDGG